MSFDAWLTLVACAGQFALFLLAVTRGARSPLGMPLALLASTFFSTGLATLANQLTPRDAWRFLMATPAPVSNAIGLHFVLSFTGRRRSLAWLMFTAYAVFGSYSALGLVAFVSKPVGNFILSTGWSLTQLCGTAVAMAVSITCLVLHLQKVSRAEQMRTFLILAAFAWVALVGATEPLADLGLVDVRLGSLAALGANFFLALAALRLGLFGRDLGTSSSVYVTAVGAFAVVGYLAVFRFLSSSLAASVAGVLGITLASIAVIRRILIAITSGRERVERLATLGRFSSQMAHDIKNPLAALKGAAQFLQEEHRRGNTLGGHGPFVDLIGEQIDRIQRVVDHYMRLGRVEPFREPLNFNELVRSVLALQDFAASSAVQVDAKLGASVPECRLDRDLVAGALENLVRNAFEAMPKGGRVTVETGRDEQEVSGDRVFVLVQDSGEGMDARTRERAFDDFFTTKPRGTGHGLAFVRRVVDAHGGEVALTSKEGVGTMVRLSFPVSGERA